MTVFSGGGGALSLTPVGRDIVLGSPNLEMSPTWWKKYGILMINNGKNKREKGI